MNLHILTNQLQRIEPIETQASHSYMPSLPTPPRDFCGKLQIHHFTTDISSPHLKRFKIFFNSSVFNFISVHLLKVCLNKDPRALHTPQFSFKILSSTWFPFHLSSYHSFFDTTFRAYFPIHGFVNFCSDYIMSFHIDFCA